MTIIIKVLQAPYGDDPEEKKQSIKGFSFIWGYIETVKNIGLLLCA